MHLGLIIKTADPERIWNGFRLANTVLDARALDGGDLLTDQRCDLFGIIERAKETVTVG